MTIDALDGDGDGVAQTPDGPVSVPFTIPGERVLLHPVHRRAGDGPARGRLITVLAPSPHRVAPVCQHFGPQANGDDACGGCTWQHIAYEEQLRLKTALVDREVRSVAPHAPATRAMMAPTPDQPWGYRHKVHFAFAATGRRGERLVMGHMARGSRRVIPIRECPVHAHAGNQVAFALRDTLTRSGVRAFGPGSTSDRAAPTGAVRGVAVRVAHATTERLTTLVAAHDRDRDLRDATRRAMARLDREGLRTSWHLNVHARDDGFIFGRTTRRLEGAERVREVVAGVSFLISPTAFFQTNVAAAELLVRLVLDAVPRDMPVLDLYAGAGLFALPLAGRGARVTAVESNRHAVDDAVASQRLNRIPQDACQWLTMPVEAAVASLRPTGAVIVDPPREGCAPGVLDAVFGAQGPAVGVYVSCNPGTLAPDLRTILGHGYAIDQTQPVDMFPHTPHIETVVVLRRTRRT